MNAVRIMRQGGVFLTIQGEGPDAGSPAVFVRFAGCNLRCSWCDTPESLPEYDVRDKRFLTVVSDNVEELHVEEVIRRINLCMYDSATRLPLLPQRVVITGGEPWLQPEAILEIHNAMIDQGTKVSIESNCEINVLQAVDTVNRPAGVRYKHSHKLNCVFSPKLARIRAGKLTVEHILNNVHVLDGGRSSLKIVVCNEDECYEAIELIQRIKKSVASVNFHRKDTNWYGIQIEERWLAAGWLTQLGTQMKLVYQLAANDIRLVVQQHKVLNLE